MGFAENTSANAQSTQKLFSTTKTQLDTPRDVRHAIELAATEKTLEDNKMDGKLLEGKLTEDNKMEDKIVNGRLMEDNKMEDKILNGRLMEDNRMEKKILNGRPMEDNKMEDKILNGRPMEDNRMEDKILNGRLTEDNKMEDKMPEGVMLDGSETQEGKTSETKHLREKLNNIYPLSRLLSRGETLEKERKMTLLASGGYNEVWLVTPKDNVLEVESLTEVKADEPTTKYILRIPNEDSLIPYQITNEVAYLNFMAARLPHIPVPKVYTYAATSSTSTSFIIEEHIPWTPLSQLWMTYTPSQKADIAYQLASIVLDLAEIRFPLIGGLDPTDFSCAPTVEGCKIFKGRRKFHRPECYNIGPYKSAEEYVRAYYDKEVYYYSNGSIDDFDDDLIREEKQRENWIARLKEKRQKLEDWKAQKEPFVLVHGDFHGRNILMNDGVITAVLDWEFAGSYPLSEVISSTDVEVVEANSQELDEENSVWGLQIRRLIREGARERGWTTDDIELLVGDADPVIGLARSELMPELLDGDQ